MNNKDFAIGFAQEIPGGLVFEIGNGMIHRRIHCINNRIGTTSLVNVTNGEEYLDQIKAEFEITITGESQTAVLESRDFEFKGYETPNWDENTCTLALKLESEVNGKMLPVTVFYEVKANSNYLRKWLQIDPCNLGGFTITDVTIEDMKLKEQVEGVTPISRYPSQFDSYEDRVHSEPDKVNVEEPGKRFSFGDLARSVTTFWGYDEGFYFFTESLFGEETFYRPSGLVMKQRDCVPLTEGFTTGAAVIGAYKGAPEVGFKAYTQHLLDHWCCVCDKQLPVNWNTWLITLQGKASLFSNYNRNLLLEYIEYIKEAGFFDVLHLDLGWEKDYPLKVDSTKFPNGMAEIARRAKEAANVDMAYWVNPFSSSYWRSKVEDEHPEWLMPGEVNSRSGAIAVCPLSDFYDYAKERFVQLVNELNARVIYWDGSDWNIRECKSPNHGHSNQNELEIKAWKRLAEMCNEVHEAREDLIVIVFSLPFNNHRLNVVDQEQVSDTYSFPTVQSELIQRQQLYQMTWEHPYKAIYGSWYGINWHEAHEKDLSERPLKELIHAEMSMIGNGLAQAGGSLDLKQAKPELLSILKKLFEFRKRFEKYFDTYQHVLAFPDGKQIDGEGHIIDGKGFIVLINPTDQTLNVKLPLNEAELELSTDKEHEITDWSNLSRGIPTDTVKISEAPEIEMVPFEVKYIGVNISE